ncbi:SpoVT/AbrB-like protein [Peptoniphilus harei]|uniref:SpoVT/AbrB-like protein n=1 Tax=Peptoniphilus harei TaxID=54005 RepID=A0A133PRD3_9FIRM|nr:AbrB/MazE/SpoVT family DNA-binding domain-containing protein [Peptoniphilus harei]KXA31358.1 SpoVT/AbrB-like protein [Peptoniphilus harei]
MNIKIKKWGNSQGIILPKLVLDSLGFGVDDDLDLEIQNNKIVLSKPSESFDDFSDLILADLIRKGYHGDDLLMEFKRIKSNFSEARESLRKDLLKEYEAGDMLDYEEAFND